MMITHKLSIDLARRECIAGIDAVQDDSGRAVALMLHTNGIPWTIPGTASVCIRYRKADGTGGEYDTLPDGSSAWSAQDNVLTVTLAPQVLTAAGDAVLSVTLTEAESCISTFDIPVRVQAGIPTGCEKSETYFNISAAENMLKKIGNKLKRDGFSSVILMGDSITDGAGGSGYNGNYSAVPSTNTEGYCWANVLKKYLAERFDTSVRNLGMHGSVIAQQQQELLSCVGKDDLVIWLVGTNDRSDPVSYATALRQYVTALKEKCAALLVVSNIPATKTDENAHTVTMQRMDDLTALAVGSYVPYFSMYQAFVRYCHEQDVALGDCFADHVHPNDTGYVIIFRLLCEALGLPLDPYTDYRSSGRWWTGVGSGGEDDGSCSCSGKDVALITNTDTRNESSCKEGIILASNIVPCSLVTGYDSSTATTAVSGRHITRAVLQVYTAGTITFGTVDLTAVGQELPSYIVRKQFTSEQTGMVEFPLHMDIGANETLAVQTVSDTGKLGFFVTNAADTDKDMWIWKPTTFKGTESDVGIHLYGTIYGI